MKNGTLVNRPKKMERVTLKRKLDKQIVRMCHA